MVSNSFYQGTGSVSWEPLAMSQETPRTALRAWSAPREDGVGVVRNYNFIFTLILGIATVGVEC